MRSGQGDLGGGDCGLNRFGRCGCPCNWVVFDAARTIVLGSEGLLQGEEAREVGVPWPGGAMEGLAPSRTSRLQPLAFFRVSQTTRYVLNSSISFWCFFSCCLDLGLSPHMYWH